MKERGGKKSAAIESLAGTSSTRVCGGRGRGGRINERNGSLWDGGSGLGSTTNTRACNDLVDLCFRFPSFFHRVDCGLWVVDCGLWIVVSKRGSDYFFFFFC